MIYVFFDTETTGLLKPEEVDLKLQPEIIELYMVKLQLNEDKSFHFIDEFNTFMHPSVMPIEPIITKITGITTEMVMDAPTFISQYPAISKFMTGVDVLVAHNASFDVGMLENELIRIECNNKFPWPRFHHCTVEKSMPIEHHRLKLSDLHTKATGAPHVGAHRAKEDTEALVTCYKWLMSEGYIL